DVPQAQTTGQILFIDRVSRCGAVVGETGDALIRAPRIGGITNAPVVALAQPSGDIHQGLPIKHQQVGEVLFQYASGTLGVAFPNELGEQGVRRQPGALGSVAAGGNGSLAMESTEAFVLVRLLDPLAFVV